MQVLVVEEKSAVRHLLDRLLTRLGYHVLTAPNVVEAMALMLDYQWQIDIALLDLALPGMGGLAYADTLQGQHPSLRIVFLAGHIDEATLFDVEGRGPILLKPFTTEQLQSAIGSLGDGRILDVPR